MKILNLPVKKKLQQFETHPENKQSDQASTLLVEIGALQELVKAVACPECKVSNLFLNEKKECRKGLTSVIELICRNEACIRFNCSISSVYSSAKMNQNKAENKFEYKKNSKDKTGGSRVPFSANMKAVLAARAVGIGHNQLSRFCTILGLNLPLTRRNFNTLAKILHKAALKAVNKNVKEVRNKIIEENGSADITVMFDGTWHKRGHLSHNGIGAIIHLETGFCIDYEVLCNFCNACKKGPSIENENYNDWYNLHVENCQKNTLLSSHAMETEAALIIWRRSKTMDPPMRYLFFLSDGDSKAFTAVFNEKIYGMITVQKEDCANHVAKRLGTAIRKLNPTLPRGQKIKDDIIQRLSLYYRLAISNNKNDVKGIYNAILASFLHSASTDSAHNHKLCPVGENSWCFYNKAIAQEKVPQAHTPKINKVQMDGLKPIYKRLTDVALLTRCVKGTTQNAAESLNSKIWCLCPKSRFATRTSVETATALAVLWFNKGYSGFSDVLLELGITPATNLHRLSASADKERIGYMDKKITAEARHKRLKQKLQNTQLEVARQEVEGLTYGSGEF